MVTLDLKALGRFIKATRQAQGLTQRELASRARVAQQSISPIERGAVTASLASLNAIAEALDVDVFKLLGIVFRRKDDARETSTEQVHHALRHISIPVLQ